METQTSFQAIKERCQTAGDVVELVAQLEQMNQEQVFIVLDGNKNRANMRLQKPFAEALVEEISNERR